MEQDTIENVSKPDLKKKKLRKLFSANLSAPILVLWVPCPCFPLTLFLNSYWKQFYEKNSNESM